MAAAIIQSINLYRPAGQGWRGAFQAKTVGMAMLAIVGGLAALSIYAWVRESRFERSVAAVVSADANRQAQLLRTNETLYEAGKIARLQSQIATLEERNQRLKVVLQSAADVSLGSSGGYSKLLSAVAASIIDGVWITHIDVSGVDGRLALRGVAARAELLPEYLGSIAQQAELRTRGVGSFVLEADTEKLPKSAATVSFSIAQQAALPAH